MPDPSVVRLQVVVNGIDGPLLKQFGCDCPRCLHPSRQANTSVSLLGLDEIGSPALHILFDVGQGVVDSLVANPLLHGHVARLDQICLTHWHPDHTLELNRLLVSFHHNRRRRGEPPTRTPLWCRSGSAAWLQREHSYDLTYTTLQATDENLPPGRILESIAIDHDGLSITPVTVSHFNADRASNSNQVHYACAAFVLETPQKKCVLLWDIDDQNSWLVNPHPAERPVVDLLSDADYLFVDACYWNARPTRTSHPSFEQVCEIAGALSPAETILVHLSGHPDGPGNPAFGWTNDRWQQEAHRQWQASTLPGKVTIPHIGQIFDLLS